MDIKFTGSVDIEAAASGPKRLSIVAYSGRPMSVDGFPTPVIVALNGIDLPDRLPILADHQNALGSIIASGKPTIGDGVLTVVADLAASQAATQVVDLLRSGVRLNASIGAQATQRKFLQAGERLRINGVDIVASDRGLTVVEKSVLKEVSIVAMGADSSTTVDLAAKQERKNMSLENQTPPTIEVAIADERKRVREIDTICAGLNLEGNAKQQADDLRARAVAGEIDAGQLRDGLLGIIRASRPQAPMVFGGRSFTSTKDHLSAALMVRAGYATEAEKQYGANVVQQSQHLHGASLVDLCRASLAIDGKDIPRGRSEMIRAAVSSGSLPVALGSSMDKVLSAAYRAAPASWRQFAAVKSAANFRTHTSLRPSFLGDLQQVAPGGEVKHGSFQEETYTWSVATYAKMLSIDRKQIVDDDLSAFEQIVPAFGRSAARTLSGLVATTILANTGSFWGTGNVNYFSGAATNLQASSLATAIQYLRQMKDLAGNVLDLQPAVLLVCPELEHVAKALVTSATMQRYVASGTDQAPMGNPFENVAQVVVEPRLSDSSYTGYSTTAWWLFSNPSNEAVVVGFLDGMEAPTVEYFGMDSDPNTLGVTFRIFHDFGCSLADSRASIMSKGAA